MLSSLEALHQYDYASSSSSSSSSSNDEKPTRRSDCVVRMVEAERNPGEVLPDALDTALRELVLFLSTHPMSSSRSTRSDETSVESRHRMSPEQESSRGRPEEQTRRREKETPQREKREALQGRRESKKSERENGKSSPFHRMPRLPVADDSESESASPRAYSPARLSARDRETSIRRFASYKKLKEERLEKLRDRIREEESKEDTHSPIINKRSREMTQNRVPLYQRALEMHQKKQVEIKRAKEELSKEDAGGYVGKPKINEMSKSMQRSIENLCRWGESRNEKLTRMKSEIEHREQKEYTFQPQISNKAKKMFDREKKNGNAKDVFQRNAEFLAKKEENRRQQMDIRTEEIIVSAVPSINARSHNLRRHGSPFQRLYNDAFRNSPRSSSAEPLDRTQSLLLKSFAYPPLSPRDTSSNPSTPRRERRRPEPIYTPSSPRHHVESSDWMSPDHFQAPTASSISKSTKFSSSQPFVPSHVSRIEFLPEDTAPRSHFEQLRRETDESLSRSSSSKASQGRALEDLEKFMRLVGFREHFQSTMTETGFK